MTKTRESPSPVLTRPGRGDCHGLRPRNDFVGLPRGVHPEQNRDSSPSAQNDKRRRARNDDSVEGEEIVPYRS